MAEHEEKQRETQKATFSTTLPKQGCRDRRGCHWEATALSPEGRRQETLKITSHLNSLCSPSRRSLEKFLLLSFPGHRTGMVTWLSVLVSCGYCDKAPQSGQRRRTECVLSQFRRLGVRSQGVGSAMLPLRSAGQVPPGLSSLLAAPACPRLVAGPLQSFPGSLPVALHVVPPPCMSVSGSRCPLSIRIQSH